MCTCEHNAENVKQMVFTKAKLRPFGVWFETQLTVPYKLASLHGIFLVIQKCILYHSRDTYRRWLEEITEDGPNPELAHYWERSWYSVFSAGGV